ncbi:uncharacterized protein LOC105688716 [Athalia rosae]|uniref:uncharacterized protein LOC105688716 n=1 Tax=Athalia rosae TaxID=37344 RepID=UPI0020345B9C|nr:uncharacterized protein LOC105688716 [Athalia rosae]
MSLRPDNHSTGSANPDSKPNLEIYVTELQRRTFDIHAGFLFWRNGVDVLKNLCGIVDSDGDIRPPLWKMLAFHLGLTEHQIGCIDCQFREKQGPTWCVILAFVQNNDATLMKLIDAIVKNKRLPIIFEIYEDICTLVDCIRSSTDLIKDSNSNIIRPKSMPNAPFVLRPLKSCNKIVDDPIKDDTGKINSVKPHLAVLLTFADDGAQAAHRIAQVFRSHGIGVLILEEQRHRGCYNELDLVESGMRQVDYIIPILTKGYHNAIANKPIDDENPFNELDQAYLRHIYQTFSNEIISTNRNKRVKCIGPQGEPRIKFTSPSLSTWDPEEKLPEVINRLLEG